ncbi:hypothetical protein [Streptosporangium sp. NBC_01469]|uniref:hypothetical protein n=1 Tax=Streptosporangium sp. NBC_01469 TaxID=2903898 RepID=UPI002E2DBF58|nr:hypothetical protein [Streptosporangium sp. NBC_01469]
MADVGGNSSGRSNERYIPSYDAPTAPIPAIPAEDGSIISPRVPRRFPIGDGEETVLVSRPPGSFPRPQSSPGTTSGDRRGEPGADAEQVRESGGLGTIPVRQVGGSAGPWRPDRTGMPGRPGARPPAGADGGQSDGQSGGQGVAAGWPGAAQRPGVFAEPGVQDRPGAQDGPEAKGGAKKSGGLLMRIGDIPIRVAYSLGAAVLTGVVVALIFVLFSGDEPGDPAGVGRAVLPTAKPSPTVPPITLPALPGATALQVLPGRPSTVLGAVTDTRSALTYVSLGAPWVTKAVPSFSVGQQVGAARLPRTVIASGPLPGATPAKALKSDADYRRAALNAVRWTIRNHHPAGGKVAWTASQRLAGGRGWTLAYRVTYEIKGERHTSQAALAVVDVGRRKPSVLFVTVPDTRKRLWADIAPLMASVRAL